MTWKYRLLKNYTIQVISLENKEREEVVDGYGIKLMTSGFGKEQTQRILVSGIKGYLGKRDRRRKNGRRIHLTARESNQGRIRKKMLERNSWYKARRKDDKDVPGGPHARGGSGRTEPGRTQGPAEDTCSTLPGADTTWGAGKESEGAVDGPGTYSGL